LAEAAVLVSTNPRRFAPGFCALGPEETALYFCLMAWNEQWQGFDWDRGNSEKIWLKHHILRAECEEIFTNQPLLILPDTRHSELEERFVAFGKTNEGKPLTVAFTMRGSKVRPISARKMSRKERKDYEKQAT
jgi:uncharacterized protein